MALYRKSTALGFGFGLRLSLCGWLRNVYCPDGRMNHEIVKGSAGEGLGGGGQEKRKVKRYGTNSVSLLAKALDGMDRDG